MTITDKPLITSVMDGEWSVSHDAWKGIELDVPTYYVATGGHIVFSSDARTERIAVEDETTIQVVGNEERRFIDPVRDEQVKVLATVSADDFCAFMGKISTVYPTFSYAAEQMRAETEANYERILVAGHIRHENGAFDAVQANAMWEVFDRRSYAMNVAPAGFVIEKARQQATQIVTVPDIAAYNA